MTQNEYLFSYPQQPTYFQCSYPPQDSIQLEDQSTNENDSFEIDVKPRQKNFNSPEEKKRYVQGYIKKKKTELCKNYQLTGMCKFGDTCSFAHGEHELAPKMHLHTKFKTRPCQKFFREGYCSYGIRCQYVHDEIKDIDDTQFNTFYEETQGKIGLPMILHPSQLNVNERTDIQRFLALDKKFPEFDDQCLINPYFKRSRALEKITKKNILMKQLIVPKYSLDSTDVSRKSSGGVLDFEW